MKKSIKDLTLEECAKVCIKNKECSKCELCEKHTNKCICSQLYSFKNNRTFLEKKVEIDELNKESDSQKSQEELLSKSIYLNPTRLDTPKDYYTYVDDNGNVKTTTDKTKQMSHEQIKNKVLRKR